MNATAQALIKDVVEFFKDKPVPSQEELHAKVEEVCKPYYNVDVKGVTRWVESQVTFSIKF